jgi:hypothetical protein
MKAVYKEFFSQQYQCPRAMNYRPIFTRNLNALAATNIRICFNNFTVSLQMQ